MSSLGQTVPLLHVGGSELVGRTRDGPEDGAFGSLVRFTMVISTYRVFAAWAPIAWQYALNLSCRCRMWVS